MHTQNQIQYQTKGGINISRSQTVLPYESAIDAITQQLDSQLGVLLASSYEYPGRYTRWDIGFINPPLQIIARGLNLSIIALNHRGEILLNELEQALKQCRDIANIEMFDAGRGSHEFANIEVTVKLSREEFCEERRSRQPSVFSVLRAIVNLFHSDRDNYLGLYGAFGYDLSFQFEDIKRHQQRDPAQRDMVLYLPDQIVVADHRGEQAIRYSYEFNCRPSASVTHSETTGGFRRSGLSQAYAPAIAVEQTGDHSPGEFAASVELAKQAFVKGELFEVVPGQVFYEPCKDSPSQVFQRLKKSNPAPYGALMNLGEQEYLVAASPEMFVRVRANEIETCPISGTVKRGIDAISDAQQIKTLLNSSKDEAELSMCTDVDRNDKARVCETGSVKIVGRRQIEIYSRLIHTVDHVKGRLKDEFDALDGFLAHTWAVTVTGAPKHAAMEFIEQQEKSPRLWYGGAIGQIGFDGNLNTGLTLRTMRIKAGIAEIRAGATLLIDSDPRAEEAETRLKASALIDAVRAVTINPDAKANLFARSLENSTPASKAIQVLMIDHQDSFVHNLAAYFRQCGVELITLRPAAARKYLLQHPVDMVVLSPGPSTPSKFQMSDTISLCLDKNIAIFGVCLGLQGLVEYFGGTLSQLDYPMHGKASIITHHDSPLFTGIEKSFNAGRYHSLIAQNVPDCLSVSAFSANDVVMAIEHRSLPVAAVQFHPESLLSLENEMGLRLIANAVRLLTQHCATKQTA